MESKFVSRQRVLGLERVAVQGQMPAGLKGIDAEMIEEHMWHMLLCRLSAYVLTEKLADETQSASMRVPSSWWQMFKRDHAPKRFLRRFPVKFTTHYATVHFRAKGVYPEAPIALPPEKFGQRVIFEEITQEPWWSEES